MTDRDALTREIKVALHEPSNRLRGNVNVCAEIALRHIAAARAEALEECIRAAEQHADCDKYNRAIVDVVEAIRALAQKELDQ